MRDERSTVEAGGGLSIPDYPRDSPVLLSDVLRSDEANAKVLLWQNRYRIAFLTAVGIGAVGLRMAGILRPTPIANALGGARGPPALALVAIAAYITAIALLDWWVRRAERAGPHPRVLQPAAHAHLLRPRRGASHARHDRRVVCGAGGARPGLGGGSRLARGAVDAHAVHGWRGRVRERAGKPEPPPHAPGADVRARRRG